MNSTNNNGNESPPPEDEDRSLLFGPPKEGREPAGDRQKSRRSGASASPPPSRSSPHAEPPDPAGRTRPVAPTEVASDAVQRRIEAMEKKLAALAADEADRAAAARTITEQANRIAEATEWVNSIKAAISEILASTGKQFEGLKSGNKDLDETLKQLKVLKEGLDTIEKSLGATAKGLGQRSTELGAVKQDLTTNYEAWTAEAKTSRAEMKRLSERLDAGDHMVTRLEGHQKQWTEQTTAAITENAAAQRAATSTTAGNVKEFTTTSTEFLKEFATARGAALKEARQEWTRVRRWTVPALAIALVLAAPSFVVVGAVGQNEFGIFEPHDDTHGWKRVVWGLHGKQVKDCMVKAQRTNEVVACSFDVPPP